MAVPGGLPTCLFGLVIMTLSPKFQRVGDLVANTVVVSEEKKRLPELAIFSDDRVPQLAELIPTSFVVPASMARAIADYVNQRKYLPFQRGSEIAAYVSAPLIEKFGLQSDTDYDLFLCALYYKTFVSSQTDAGSTAGVLPNGIIAQSPVGGVAAPQEATAGQLDASENELRIEKSDFRVDS
jgi:hypothetical protein